MEIRKYTSNYREDMENICIATASQKAREEKIHHDFTLAMYCDVYLEKEIALMLMDQDKPVGYILCAKSYRDWLNHMEETANRIRQFPEPYPERLELELKEYGVYPQYPAHMHIDILEGYTGGGNGTKLLKALISILKEENVSGVMLGVSGTNKRAISFYQRNGFEILDGDENGYTMGLKL